MFYRLQILYYSAMLFVWTVIEFLALAAARIWLDTFGDDND